jgi:hypothetical protein
MQTIEAILNEIDDKTGLAQALAQIIARFRLILDNQNFQQEELPKSALRRIGLALKPQRNIP